jgi:hypothetical protein
MQIHRCSSSFRLIGASFSSKITFVLFVCLFRTSTITNDSIDCRKMNSLRTSPSNGTSTHVSDAIVSLDSSVVLMARMFIDLERDSVSSLHKVYRSSSTINSFVTMNEDQSSQTTIYSDICFRCVRTQRWQFDCVSHKDLVNRSICCRHTYIRSVHVYGQQTRLDHCHRHSHLCSMLNDGHVHRP